MSIYVTETEYHVITHRDLKQRGKRFGHKWCTMMADSADELHTTAALLGLARIPYFQEHGAGPMYDRYLLGPKNRAAAVDLGARPMTFKAACLQIALKHKAAKPTTTETQPKSDEHEDHGKGGEGPEESDCPCRGTSAQAACCAAQCGFCSVAPSVAEVSDEPVLCGNCDRKYVRKRGDICHICLGE